MIQEQLDNAGGVRLLHGPAERGAAILSLEIGIGLVSEEQLD